MKLLVVMTMLIIGLFVSAIAGTFSNLPGLMLAWVCISPFILPVWGAAIYRFTQRRRPVLLTETEYEQIRRARGNTQGARSARLQS